MFALSRGKNKMSTLNNDGINLSITTPHHCIGTVSVGIADIQPPPVQHRHVILVVVAAVATRPPPPPVTPGRDGAGGSTKEEKGR